MVVQKNNLTTDYTLENPITTFKVTIERGFKQHHFDVKIHWNHIPEYCEHPAQVACQQVVNFLSMNKNYKKINSGMLGDFNYTAYFNKK